MAKFVVKVDFLNNRVEFSPNVKVVVKRSKDADKPVFILEALSSMNEKKYPAFTLTKNDVGDEEVYDEEDKFWKGLVDLSGVPASAPTQTPAPAPVSKPAAPVKSAPIPAPTPVPVKPAAPHPDTARLSGQFESMKRMLAAMDGQFAAGKIPQAQYLEKKNFMAQQMGNLIGEMEAKGIPYQL